MQQSCPYGSVRGASGNRRPYRDKRASKIVFRARVRKFPKPNVDSKRLDLSTTGQMPGMDQPNAFFRSLLVLLGHKRTF